MTFIVLTFLGLLLSNEVKKGQATSNYVAPMSAAAIKASNRTNLCTKLANLFSGTVSLSKALAGTTITAAIHYGTPQFAMVIDNTTGLPTDGFYYHLQQEISIRGGFTFQYMNVPNCMISLGTQKCLQYNLPHFDIYANNWYSDTAGRRFIGIGYTQQLVDASVVFITHGLLPASNNVGATTKNYLWNIFNPFTKIVWVTIICVVIFNTFSNYIFERYTIDEFMHRPEEHLSHKGIMALFYILYDDVLMVFGKSTIHPNSWISCLLYSGFSFFAMLLVASYTASLASFLIDASQPPVYLASIDEANSNSVAVCGMVGQTSFLALNNYPRIRQVSINTNQPPILLKAMQDGQCVGIVLGRSDWDLYSQSLDSNGNCDQFMRGDPLAAISGAWPYTTDFSNKCTSLLEYVISDIIVGMKQDGTLAKLYKNAIDASSTNTCPITLTPSDTVIGGNLQIKEISGAFVIYAGFCVLAVVTFVFKWLRRRVKALELLMARIEGFVFCASKKETIVAVTANEEKEDSTGPAIRAYVKEVKATGMMASLDNNKNSSINASGRNNIEPFVHDTGGGSGKSIVGRAR